MNDQGFTLLGSRVVLKVVSPGSLRWYWIKSKIMGNERHPKVIKIKTCRTVVQELPPIEGRQP